jgi:hypothetical protein
MRIHRLFALVLLAATAGIASAAHADNCTRVGVDVTCDDGRRGVLAGDAILWPDGTRSSSTPHPSVIIGNKSSVVVGPGVMVGHGNGMVPSTTRTRRTRSAAPYSRAYRIATEIPAGSLD